VRKINKILDIGDSLRRQAFQLGKHLFYVFLRWDCEVLRKRHES
jgi:hypothetical protein